MRAFKRKDRTLINYVKRYGNKSEQEAIEYLDRFCGDWQNTPVPKAKRFKSLGVGDGDE